MTASISIAAPGYNYLGLLEYLSTHLDRYTPTEAVVALFCLHRTLRFNKQSEAVPVRHMVEGIPEVIHGVGLARNTVKRALKGLQEKGFLRVHCRKAHGKRDMAPKIEIVCKMSKLRISKKYRESQIEGEGSNADPMGSKIDHLKEDTIKEEKSSSSRTTRAPHALVEDEKEKNRKIRQAKAQRLTKIVNSGTISKAWKSICVEYHPKQGQPAFTKRILSRVTGQLRHHEQSVDNPYEFMEWCILNWGLLKRKEFKKFDFVKPTPDIGVWGTMMSSFVGFYATREYYTRQSADDLPATTTAELERQLEEERAILYETRSKLKLMERVVDKYRSEKK